MTPSIYIAYQGDINNYQAIEIVNEPDVIDAKQIAAKVSQAFKACLRGWWDQVDCVHSGYVVRITKEGWEAWSVEYEDGGSQGSCQRISAGNDPSRAPTSWPAFLFLDEVA